MKAKVLIVALSVVVMVACSKDKYNTTPTLTFKSVSETTVPQSFPVQFSFEVTDKEGDIQDTMWLEKFSYTCGDEGHILAPLTVPDFDKRNDLKANISINVTYGSDFGGCAGRDDSCYFRFWIKDKAGNISDTVQSPTMKLLKG